MIREYVCFSLQTKIRAELAVVGSPIPNWHCSLIPYLGAQWAQRFYVSQKFCQQPFFAIIKVKFTRQPVEDSGILFWTCPPWHKRHSQGIESGFMLWGAHRQCTSSNPSLTYFNPSMHPPLRSAVNAANGFDWQFFPHRRSSSSICRTESCYTYLYYIGMYKIIVEYQNILYLVFKKIKKRLFKEKN